MTQLLLTAILVLDIIAVVGILGWARARRNERAIRHKAMQVVLSLPQGVVLAGPDQQVMAMNGKARVMFLLGEEADGFLEKRLPFFDVQGAPIRVADHPFKRALRTRHSTALTKFWIRDAQDRLVPVSVTVGYIPSARGAAIVVGLIRDISREELMETMKRDFIGIASHQLRSPLASLKWYGEMLTHDARKQLDAKRRQYLDRMNDATARMISLIDDFLDASKFETYVQTAHVDNVSLKELIAHILDVHQPLIETKRLTMRVSQRGIAKPVYADPAMLREMLANFVANAVKYNRKGGKVTVVIHYQGDAVEIQVRDTGVGIPKDQQSRVFTKFFRADNAVAQGYKGTGLGLYTAKLILEQMKGNVRFASSQGNGTTFWVQFPRDQRQQQE